MRRRPASMSGAVRLTEVDPVLQEGDLIFLRPNSFKVFLLKAGGDARISCTCPSFKKRFESVWMEEDEGLLGEEMCMSVFQEAVLEGKRRSWRDQFLEMGKLPPPRTKWLLLKQ